MTAPKKGPTPLTDAAARSRMVINAMHGDNRAYVEADFARDLERDRARLVAALKHWTHDGHLQTFEDRERFRKDAKDLLRDLGEA